MREKGLEVEHEKGFAGTATGVEPNAKGLEAHENGFAGCTHGVPSGSIVAEVAISVRKYKIRLSSYSYPLSSYLWIRRFYGVVKGYM